MAAWNGPCEVCLSADHSMAPIEVATHVMFVERDGQRVREPVCERHAKAAQRYRIAHGIRFHEPLRARPEPAPQPQAERLH